MRMVYLCSLTLLLVFVKVSAQGPDAKLIEGSASFREEPDHGLEKGRPGRSGEDGRRGIRLHSCDRADRDAG